MVVNFGGIKFSWISLSFLPILIYEVSVIAIRTWCLRYNICNAWFLDISISTCFYTKWWREIHKAIDLSQAYLQLPWDEKSHKLTTISTHKGLYQYIWLPYGITFAPAIFQMIIDKILQGLNKASCYLDDILVTGKDDTEHITNLQRVFERL